jgi:hypothetical protein
MSAKITPQQKAAIEKEIQNCGGAQVAEGLYMIGFNSGDLRYWGERFEIIPPSPKRPARKANRRNQAAWGEYAWFVAVAQATTKKETH